MPFHSSSLLATLFDAPMHPGQVRWIGLRPERRAPIVPVDHAVTSEAVGLEGDRYGKAGGKRQVTLITSENLRAIAGFLHVDQVSPESLRRNIVVEGINLLALKERQVRIGDTVLEITGECHPCSRMEEILGPGGYNAVRGHGGVTARVIGGGTIRIGDEVRRVPNERA